MTDRLDVYRIKGILEHAFVYKSGIKKIPTTSEAGSSGTTGGKPHDDTHVDDGCGDGDWDWLGDVEATVEGPCSSFCKQTNA